MQRQNRTGEEHDIRKRKKRDGREARMRIKRAGHIEGILVTARAKVTKTPAKSRLDWLAEVKRPRPPLAISRPFQ
jgi:hypothetical protein